jgi:serine/threonine protein kinase
MDNILITNDNSIKVIDFGLAIHAFLNTFSNPKCGTPGYMAPEVANLPNK